MKNKLVSVILPTYNRIKYLDRSVHSVLNQTYKNLELIIVDDGSNDSSEEWISKLSDSRLKYLKQDNSGVSKARNKGVSISQGEWVSFLDSDDEWLCNKLEMQMQAIESHPDHFIIHTNEIWIRDGVRVNPHKKHEKKGGRLFKDCIRLCCISPSTVLLAKDLFLEFGGFREDFPICEDYDLWLKISSKYEVLYIEDFLIKKYGGHEDQLSQKFKAMDYWRLKSLISIKDSPHISDLERDLVLDSILKRKAILINGYKKHGHLDMVNEINTMC